MTATEACRLFRALYARHAEALARIIEDEPLDDFREGHALTRRVADDLMALRASLKPAASFALVRRLDNILAVCTAIQAVREPGPEDDADALAADFWNAVEAMVESLGKFATGGRQDWQRRKC